MSKFLLAAVTAAVVLAQPAYAAMDCGGSMDKSVSSIMKMTAASAEKRAALHRMALSGYDHCMAGDEINAKSFWDMVSTAASK